PPGMPGYDATDDVQKFDPAAAKQLLSQSKYANTDSLKNLKFTYPASAANKTRIEWLQQQWQTNLGITVAPDPVDATTFTSLQKPWVKGIQDTVMDFEYGIFDQINIGVTAKK